MNYLQDLYYTFVGYVFDIPEYALKLVVLYFFLKYTIKKALQEHQKYLDERNEKE